MKVKEVADLVGISVRTLHHYDEIGLLKPDKITESGYRVYSEKNLDTLQQILFFRELGFPLKKIREMINSPSYDRQKALEVQHRLLLERRRQLDRMIRTIEKTIIHSKGEIEMTNKEKFEGFDFSHNKYEEEARKLWGDSAVDESNAKIAKWTDHEKKDYNERFTGIFRKIAALRHLPPDAEEVQAVMKQWYMILNEIGSYSPDAFKGLGQLYVDDARFTENIDKYGQGLAKFMCDAMAVYADSDKKQ